MKRRKSDGKPVGTLDKKPKNKIEAQCYDLLKENGFSMVTKRGMPDFFCLDCQGKITLVECKKSGQKLSKPQFLLFEKLSSFGIPCYYFSPSVGLKRFRNFKRKK